MPKRYRDIVGDGGSNILVQVEELQARLRARMARVRKKVAVTSGKGGVGKSVLTANLASILAADGRRVGVLDADLNGPSMAKLLGVRGQHLHLSPVGVHPAEGPLGIRVRSMDLLLPEDRAPLTWEAPTQQDAFVWRGTMEATALRELLADTAWGDLDLLLLDLPPGAPTLPTLAGLLDLDGALVVTIPSEVAGLVVSRLVELARTHGVRLLGLVENMAGYLCVACGTLGELFPGDGESLAETSGLPLLARIPFDPRIAWCPDRGRPYALEHPESPGGQALRALAARLRALLWEEGAER